MSLHKKFIAVVPPRVSDEKLCSIVEALPDGLLVLRNDGVVESINPAARTLLSTNIPNAVGRHYEEIVWIASVQRFIADILADGFTREDEAVLDAGNGERYLRLYGTPVGDSHSSVSYLIVITDITSLKMLEKVRSDFVANVSHELKTPITVIQGFVETLLAGPHDPADASRFLTSIGRQTDRLSHLFDDLLLLSRLEQEHDKVKIARAPHALLPVLSGIIDSFEMKSREKTITVNLDCSPLCMADVNPNLFEQAIVNLIQNAIEHTPVGGKVTVSAQEMDRVTSVSVKDTGCGIEPSQTTRIFERFYRIDTGRARKQGGTGLGLSIVKHIAQLHGGRVSVTSVVGEGSEFVFEVPAV